MHKLGRAIAWVFAALCLAFSATAAAAACAGENILDRHRAEDPDGIAEMFARAHAVPNAQGRFWQISRAGTGPSYLFGTFHVPSVISTVTPDVWEALDQARVAIFEVSLAQQAEMQQRIGTDPNFAFDFQAPPLSTRLTPDEREHLYQALSARGIQVATAEQMRPWLLASLLGFPACHLRAVSEGGPALDVAMARRAEQNGAEIVGLETYEQALSVFERVDIDILLTSFGNAGKLLEIEEDLFRTNTDLYAAGEIEAINEYAIWMSDRIDPKTDNRAQNRAFMAELLDMRNRAWMVPLMAHLGEGGAFIAVGALHLPGDAGLIELLRAAGFDVIRLDGDPKK